MVGGVSGDDCGCKVGGVGGFMVETFSIITFGIEGGVGVTSVDGVLSILLNIFTVGGVGVTSVDGVFSILIIASGPGGVGGLAVLGCRVVVGGGIVGGVDAVGAVGGSNVGGASDFMLLP